MKNTSTLIEKMFHILKRVSRKLKNLVHTYLLQFDLYNRAMSRGKLINTPEEILWVNPSMIRETALNYDNEDVFKSIGRIRAGDWDKRRTTFEHFELYKSLKTHFMDNIALSETLICNLEGADQEIYDNPTQTYSWYYITPHEYKKRSKSIDALFHSIKENGFRTQQELGGVSQDEILVKISRQGDLLFENGIHRLICAKILGIEEIPVIVRVRHADWIALKEQLLNYLKKEHVGAKYLCKLSQKFHHPDLQDISDGYECEERFEAMKKHLKSKSGDVLDLGANFGFFCQCFEGLGYDCTAVEWNDELVYFLQKLKRAEKSNFEIINGNALDIFDKRHSYDVVLAINIFHHFLEKESDYNKLITMLKNIDMREMFFEHPGPRENTSSNVYMNFEDDQFIDLILSNTALVHYKKILDCREGRSLYYLWRD